MRRETFWCWGVICLRLFSYAFVLGFYLGLVCVEGGRCFGFVADKTKGRLIAKKALRNSVRI